MTGNAPSHGLVLRVAFGRKFSANQDSLAPGVPRPRADRALGGRRHGYDLRDVAFTISVFPSWMTSSFWFRI
jgi:hypothetical protein